MNLTISMNSVLDFLHSMALSTSNKRWLADHLYEEVRAEEKAASTPKAKRNLTEKEKDELFFSVAGAWKDDPVGDDFLEAIRIGRQSASYERKPRTAASVKSQLPNCSMAQPIVNRRNIVTM